MRSVIENSSNRLTRVTYDGDRPVLYQPVVWDSIDHFMSEVDEAAQRVGFTDFKTLSAAEGDDRPDVREFEDAFFDVINTRMARR